MTGWGNPNSDPCDRHGIACSGGYVTNITLSGCALNGTIPENSVFAIRGLKWLDLSNQPYHGNAGLQGTLPADLMNASSLQTLDLNTNTLRGPVPSLKALKSLGILNLHYNQFTGSLPELSAMNITYVSFATNDFEGSIPSGWASALTKVTILGLANNRLTGQVSIIENFLSLGVVFLRNNSFSGEVPKLPFTTAVADFDHNKFTSFSEELCLKPLPHAFDSAGGCSSDYPQQEMNTCCFGNNSFGVLNNSQPIPDCLIPNCFERLECNSTRGCTACPACCNDYLPDGKACSECFREHC
jgi:hypothetical protein